MKHRLFNGDCLDVLKKIDPVQCIFADPPDNIGLGYDHYDDKLADAEYVKFLTDVLELCVLQPRSCGSASTQSGPSQSDASSTN